MADVTIDLAEKLVGMAPVPMSKAFFTNSGSEANDSAVKLVWYYNNAIGRPEKKKIIARIKGYHGVTVAAACLTGLPDVHRDFDLPIARILHADCPHYYRFGKPGESEEQFATRLAESLEQMIVAEGPDTVAAFFAEPMMGAGGVIIPPEDLFREDPGGAEEIRRAVHRRRGDLRLRAHRQHVRHARPSSLQARHHHRGEGPVLGLSADLPALLVSKRIYDGISENTSQDRHVRPRLHLFRPSGLLGRRARDAEDLSRSATSWARCAACRRAS